MKYTKEQLQAMSDRKIDCALCEIVHDAEIVANLFNEGNHFAARTKSGVDFWVPEYCNTPNDIMPLAFEHHLTVHYVDNGYEHKWFATKPYSPEHFHHTNPLRAIACCLILVLSSDENQSGK
jgi:hypothetical protein